MNFWSDVYAPFAQLPTKPIDTPVVNGHAIHDKIVSKNSINSTSQQLSDLTLVDGHSTVAENGDSGGGNSLVESVKKEEEKCCS